MRETLNTILYYIYPLASVAYMEEKKDQTTAGMRLATVPTWLQGMKCISIVN